MEQVRAKLTAMRAAANRVHEGAESTAIFVNHSGAEWLLDVAETALDVLMVHDLGVVAGAPLEAYDRLRELFEYQPYFGLPAYASGGDRPTSSIQEG